MQTSSISSVKPSVVSRLQEGKIHLEIYSDGACVLEVPGILGAQEWSQSFIRDLAVSCNALPAPVIVPVAVAAEPEVVKDIASKSNAVKKSSNKKKSSTNKKSAAGKKNVTKTRVRKGNKEVTAVYDRGEYRRKIVMAGAMNGYQDNPDGRAAVSTENAWKVIFTHRKTLEVLEHCYLNRGFARKGRVGMEIGTNGRLS